MLEKMDLSKTMDKVTYYDAPLKNQEALQYLLSKKGNIIGNIHMTDDYIIHDDTDKKAPFTHIDPECVDVKYSLSELVTELFNPDDDNNPVWFKGKRTQPHVNVDNLILQLNQQIRHLNRLCEISTKISLEEKEKTYKILYNLCNDLIYLFDGTYSELTVNIDTNSKMNE